MPPINLSPYIVIAFACGFLFMIIKAFAQKFDTRPKQAAADEKPNLPPAMPEPVIGKPKPASRKRGQQPKTQTQKQPVKIKWYIRLWSWSKKVLPGGKMVIETSQYFATVCGAFVALCVTFMLNSEKTTRDKKNHLLDVLTKYQQENLDWHNWLGNVNALMKMGIPDRANAVFWKGLKTHPYPFFENYRDPAIFEITPVTAGEMRRRDLQVKILLDADSAHKTLEIAKQVDVHLKYSFDHITLEGEFIRHDIDSAAFVDSSIRIIKKLDNSLHAF